MHWNALCNFGGGSLRVVAPAAERAVAPAALGVTRAKRAGGALESGGLIHLRRLRWGNRGDMTAARSADDWAQGLPFDVLLGSDIMYHQAHHSALAVDTIVGLTTVGSVVWWSSSDGDLSSAHGLGFYERLRQHGFEIVDVSARPEVLALREISGYSTGNWSRIDRETGNVSTSVHVMRMVRRSRGGLRSGARL